jgi:signal transduction histidine kinase
MISIVTEFDEASGQRAFLGSIIESNIDEIEQRWLARVRQEVSGRQLDLPALRDGIRDYLRFLAEELSTSEDIEPTGSHAWMRTAQEHGITRVRLGFDIDELVHEFNILRQTLFELAREQGIQDDADQLERIADLIGVATAEAVRSYVESRDYENRRLEAQHIGYVIHELRNPLTTAMLAAGRARSQALTEESAHSFEVMARSHERLRHLIDDVLDLERLAAGATPVRPIDIKLGEIMEAATRAAWAEAQAKRIALHVAYDSELSLHVDPALTRSIVQNLVDNAVKFTDFGTVSVEVDETADQFVVHVLDNCNGISPEELRIVFQPFRRGHSHGKSGSGLGLAIAQRAALAQGGTIQVESSGERGCHFWVTLPRYVEAPAPHVESSAPPPG